MKTMLNVMKKKKNNISAECINLFEDIMRNYEGSELDEKFVLAMNEHLTQEQRFAVWAQNGSCRGTGHDKNRKTFAAEHSGKPLRERFDAFTETIGSHYKAKPRDIILDEKNKTITVTFVCKHGLMHLEKGQVKEPLELYFGGCSGGRLHELQLALGIKLKIKEVDVSAVKQSIYNPCVFVFEIID